MQRFLPRRLLPFLILPVAATLLSACGAFPSKEDDESKKKNTLDCTANGQRYLLRFQDKYEMRLLMPDGEMVYLYQMQTPSGSLRFGNDSIEVRSEGRDLDLVLVQNRRSSKMDCKPYQVEDEKQREQDQKKLK